MKERKTYVSPEVEIIRFSANDILATSGGTYPPEETGIDLPIDPF